MVTEDLSMKAEGISMDYYTSSAAREEKGPLVSHGGHNLTTSWGLDAQTYNYERYFMSKL